MITLYQINCEHGYIYVGISGNVGHRIEQHFVGNGSSVTKMYKPLASKILAHFGNEEDAKKAEKRYTLLCKKRFGKNKVFGGRWTS